MKPERGGWWIFAILFVAYAYFYQAGGWNQNTRFDLVRAIVDDGAVTIDRYVANTDDRADCGAHACSDKAPGLALLAVPAVAATTLVTHDVVARSYVATVATSGLAAAIAGALVFAIALRLGTSRRGAAVVALIFGLGSPMWCYATLLTGHALAVGLLVVTLAAGLALRDATDPRRARWLAFAVGLASGWTTITEFPSAVPAAVLALFALGGAARTWRRVPWVVAGGAIAAIALALYNVAAFGSIFHLGYQDVTKFPGMKRGLFGIGAPDLAVLVKVLVGHYRGLWFFAPVLALGYLGIARLVRRRETRALGLVLGALATYAILLDAGYAYWDGGSSYGPRHAAAAIAWLSIGLAPLWQSGPRARFAIGAFAIAGVCCAAIAVSTDGQPIINEHHPLGAVLWPAFSSGQLSINMQSFEQLRPGRVRAAWNLGQRLFGLERWWSLAPLAGVWLAIALRTLPRPRIDARAIHAWAARSAWWLILVGIVALVVVGGFVAIAPGLRADTKFQIDQLQALRIPAWNPYDGLGYPFFADPGPGTLYPVQWLVIALGSILDDAPGWLVGVKVALHAAILGFGMFALVRGKGRAAGLAGAIVAMACAPMLAALAGPVGWSIAWLPWVLVAIDRWADAPTAWRALPIGVAAAMLVLAGDPGAIAWCAIAIVPWGAAAMIREGLGARDAVRALAVAALVVALLAGAQLGALVDALPEMVHRETFAWSPRWIGVTAPVLAAIGVVRGPLRARAIGLAIVLAACIACGALADPRGYVVAAVPLAVLAADGIAAIPRLRAVIVVAIVVDLLIAAGRTPHAPDVDKPAVASQPGLPLDYRIADRDPRDAHPGTRLRLRDLGGEPTAAYVPARYADFARAVAAAPHLAAYANVAYLVDDPDPAARLPFDANVIPRRTQVFSIAAPAPAVAWFDRAELVANRAAALPAVFAVASKSHAVVEADALEPDEAARATHLDTPSQASAPGHLTVVDPDAVAAKVTAPADGIVAVTELYWPRYWRATVDDRPARIVPVNGFARGVFVERGAHAITMWFTPPIWYQAWVWIGFVVWLVGGAIAWRMMSRAWASR